MFDRVRSLSDLFVYELKDLYDAELRIIDALPKMRDACSTPELKRELDKHLDQSITQKDTLEQIFKMIGVQPERGMCKGVSGAIDEGLDMIRVVEDSAVRDAGLIGAVQKVEHYEIAGYGTLREHARKLGYGEAAMLIQKILDQEGQTDHELTILAEETVNPRAAFVSVSPVGV